MLFLLEVGVSLLVIISAIAWVSRFFFERRLEPAFVGALVAASGTIFAACIAYNAASKSLEIAQANNEQAEKQRVENEKSQKRLREIKQHKKSNHREVCWISWID
jgi:hypothetical protein